MTHYDIAVIGSGSGNSLLSDDFATARVALISDGPFGGTCLNVGCIPTKMFVHSSDVARTVRTAQPFGVSASLGGVSWPEIRDRIFGRIDPIAAGSLKSRSHDDHNSHIDVYTARARLVDHHTIDIAGQTITADTIVLATGSRPAMPDIAGINEVGVHTSDTIMRLAELPERLTIIGSGFIAAEFAAVFSALGTAVTLVARSQRILAAEDTDVSDLATRLMSDDVTLLTNATTTALERTATGITVSGHTPAGEFSHETDVVLIATGRIPNSDVIGDAAIDLHDDGRIAVDEYHRVLSDGKPIAGLWSVGDVSSPFQLKHVANHETRTLQHNLLHPHDLRRSSYDAVPHAVFGHPPIGAVGMTERAARECYDDVVVGQRDYGSIAYGWAMNDPEGFAKIIARSDGTILGAHIIGPEAPTLIQPLIQAMSTGQRVHDITRTQYWIHPAMPEIVENALLDVMEQLAS